MAQLNEVSLFKNVAIKALYEGIVAELVNCQPENHSSEIAVQEEEDGCCLPAEKKRKMDETVDASSPSTTSLTSSLYSSHRREHLVEEIRTRLSEYLVSSYCYVRHQLVKRFFNTVTVTGWSGDIILSFLDCLLDDTFTEWAFIRIVLQDKHPLAVIDPVKLLGVLASRSPLIHTLQLNFGLPGRSVPLDPIVGQMLASFKNLNSLSLSLNWKTTDRSCLLFFEALGDSCPNLITLELFGHLPFGIQQVLALMLGKKRELLPQHFLEDIGGEEALAELQFTPESLTPICNSLKNIRHMNPDGCLNRVFCSSAATAAPSFILRHFPQLKTWDNSREDFANIGIVVQLLHQQQQQWTTGKRSFKRQSRTSIELGLIQWRMTVPFSGIYYLLAL